MRTAVEQRRKQIGPEFEAIDIYQRGCAAGKRGGQRGLGLPAAEERKRGIDGYRA